MFPKINLFSKKDRANGRPAEVKVTLSILEKARKDWKILLLSAIVVAIMVVLIDAYLLWRVNKGDIFTTETVIETDTTITDKRMLENVVKFFDARKTSFEKFKNTPRAEIDPSL